MALAHPPAIPEGISDPRRKLLTVALAELGTRERTGKNDGPVTRYMPRWATAKGLPWCAWFVGWAWHEATGAYLWGRHYGGAWDLYDQGRRHGQLRPSCGLAAPGDVFVILHGNDPSKRSSGHTGYVLRVDLELGLCVTIEGNYRNGVGCAVRSLGDFAGIVNPHEDEGLGFVGGLGDVTGLRREGPGLRGTR